MPLDLKRQPMPMQDPGARGRNFSQVALGYSREQAMAESARCIQCKKPTCRQGCPVMVRIPEFIKAMHEDKMEWRTFPDIVVDFRLVKTCGCIQV